MSMIWTLPIVFLYEIQQTEWKRLDSQAFSPLQIPVFPAQTILHAAKTVSNSTDTNSARPNIFFSVGEPSGDLHAARLMRELGAENYHFRGFGGVKMSELGCQLDFQLTDLAVVGFVEVVPKLREFFRVADIASEIFKEQKPSAVVLVDFPGFNWHIAKRAKAEGIPVYYYLPPQLWAWGSWRVKKMRRFVDHILCNLPFEKQWYEERGLEASYVGHPFFDDLSGESLDREFMAVHQNPAKLTVAVLPGSRGREVKNIWPMQLNAIRELHKRHPHAKFSIACLKPEHKSICEAMLKDTDKSLPIEFFVNRTSELIELADCALMKSGSVSLEFMARGTPAVVIYHVGRTFYHIGRRLTNLQSMTLPNLIAERTVMPEFLAIGSNRQPTIDSCIEAMDQLMGDADARAAQRNELEQLTQAFGRSGASTRAADYISASLNTQQCQTSEPAQKAVA